MHVFTIFELIFVILATIYLLYSYSAKNVPFLVKFVCFCSWFFSFAILIFVPLDVYYTVQQNAQEESGKQTEGYHDMVVVWRVFYWTSFAFTWFVLPMFNAYVKAGEFTVKERLKRMVKVNLINYTIMAVCGLIFFFYLKITNRVGKEGIVSFFITYANCFGVLLIILCLSYGLVAIPKRCFQHTKQAVNLKTHQFRSAVDDEARDNVLFDLYELVRVLETLLKSSQVSSDDKEIIMQIQSRAPEGMVSEIKSSLTSANAPSLGTYSKLTKRKLITLNRTMKKLVNGLNRAENQRTLTLKKTLFLEDILDSENPSEWKEKPSYKSPRLSVCESLYSFSQWAWYAHLSKVVFFILAMVFVFFSAVIFIAEILNFMPVDTFNLESFIKDGRGAVARSQFLCLFPLGYICLCVYTALFSLKLAGRYGLYKHHHTDAPSLMFFTINFSRVSSPMVFNFLQILKLKGTAFHSVMGDAKLAQAFVKYVPALLIVLLFCNIFEIYGRFLSKLGLGNYKFNEEATNEKVEEGKVLLKKVRNAKIREKGKRVPMEKYKTNSTADEVSISVYSSSKKASPKDKKSLSSGDYLNSEDKPHAKSLKSLSKI